MSDIGYFSNWIEGNEFEQTYCANCEFFKIYGQNRMAGCPIIDIHILWDSSRNRDIEKDRALKTFLYTNDETGKMECYFFKAIEQHPESQLHLKLFDDYLKQNN